MDLSVFCGRNYTKPFNQGEYTCFTDGIVAVRVAKIDEYNGQDGPKLGPLFEGHEIMAIIPLSTIEIDTATCPVCQGKSHLPKECPECSGSGVIEFDNEYSEYEVVCNTCDGKGSINECKKCRGTGIDDSMLTEIHGTHFRSHYIEKLKNLPHCQLKINAEKGKPSLFCFDGGDGVIMACIKYRVG